MPGDLPPEYVLDQLKKGVLSSLYLFYGPSEFHMEKVLNKVRETFIPETARDFNLRIFYGDEADPADIIDTAQSLPFMSQRRLIIVRRTEKFSPQALESFIPYLDMPVESTCLIFVSSKPNFRRRFYRRIRELGQAINFTRLSDSQVVPWIKEMAKDLGLHMDSQACAYLHQIVGNRLQDLYSELEKLYVRHGEVTVGIEEVEELAIYSRMYTIFEVMDEVSFKKRAKSISILNRFLEEEGKDEILRVLGMLNRQIRLLWQTKSVMEEGGRMTDVAKKLGLRDFQVRKLVQQSKLWTVDNLERAFHLLYQADGLLKSGGKGHLVLENLVLSLCK